MANEDQNNNNNEDFQRGLLLDTKPKTKRKTHIFEILQNKVQKFKHLRNYSDFKN